MQDETTDRPTDTGMLGSDAENPGPGRDTRQTDPDPTATSSEHPTKPVGMSGSDPERTRLGTQETSGRPLAGAPQDTTSSGQADTGMVGSETENPGPGPRHPPDRPCRHRRCGRSGDDRGHVRLRPCPDPARQPRARPGSALAAARSTRGGRRGRSPSRP
jgi:hypothetical protein